MLTCRTSRCEAENPNAPTEDERELVVDEAHNNEDDFERLMKMDEEWPDHFEERSRPVAAPRSKKKAPASTTPWPTWWRGRNRCKTICTINWAGST